MDTIKIYYSQNQQRMPVKIRENIEIPNGKTLVNQIKLDIGDTNDDQSRITVTNNGKFKNEYLIRNYGVILNKGE